MSKAKRSAPSTEIGVSFPNDEYLKFVAKFASDSFGMNLTDFASFETFLKDNVIKTFEANYLGENKVDEFKKSMKLPKKKAFLINHISNLFKIAEPIPQTPKKKQKPVDLQALIDQKNRLEEQIKAEQAKQLSSDDESSESGQEDPPSVNLVEQENLLRIAELEKELRSVQENKTKPVATTAKERGTALHENLSLLKKSKDTNKEQSDSMSSKSFLTLKFSNTDLPFQIAEKLLQVLPFIQQIIESKQSIPAHLCLALKEMPGGSVATMFKNMKQSDLKLAGNFSFDTVDSWSKALIAMGVEEQFHRKFATGFENSFPPAIAFFNRLRLHFPEDSDLIEFVWPYWETLKENAFAEAARTGIAPTLHLFRDDSFPPEHFDKIYKMRMATQVLPSLSAARVSANQHYGKGDDDRNVAAAASAYAPSRRVTIESRNTDQPCYSLQLTGGCPDRRCTFCKSNGNYCMACSEIGHGASDCTHKAKQLDYFIRRLTPNSRNQTGSNPVYGGSAEDLLGAKFDRLKRNQREEKLMSVAEKLQVTAIELRNGSMEPEQKIVYPAARQH